jgi:hypothetical protein
MDHITVSHPNTNTNIIANPPMTTNSIESNHSIHHPILLTSSSLSQRLIMIIASMLK